jgi:outer membrane protein assembly factor BamB
LRDPPRSWTLGCQGGQICYARKGRALILIVVLLGFAGRALASGITNSSEDLRTGWYPAETSITPELIEGGTFGREWSTPVVGQVYAQPLLDGGTLLVATEKNRVYGLDPASGAVKWSSELPHGTPWNPSDIGCADLPYQGWVFGVSTEGTVKARWASASEGGGIWQSGAGLSSDGPGQILLATGNGDDPKPPLAESTAGRPRPGDRAPAGPALRRAATSPRKKR